MRSACVLLRAERHYRREIFEEGLRRLGCNIISSPKKDPRRGDILLLWNRLRTHEQLAKLYEHRGGDVLIAENGYIGLDSEGRNPFALARGFHNGAGQWKVGGPERWPKMNVELKPWRTKGEFVLLLPQRGIGCHGIAMPHMWSATVRSKLSLKTQRPVVMRAHPGNAKSEPYPSFKGAWAVVTWGSGAAIKALASGIPVFYELEKWIGAPAGKLLNNCRNLEQPFLGDRMPMFHRLAWAQWSPGEIESGEAFAWLLR